MFKKVMHIFMLAAILAGLISLTPATPARAAGLCYVNDDAAGSNNGSSWTNAYTSLQSAIADTCTEIWVAAGTYKPHASDRAISFNLESGTAIYGGFAGTETLLSQRNYVTNVTILSGDLNGNDSGFTNNAENSYHVVSGTSTANTAILDGFTIIGGNANGTFPNFYGGGMMNFSGNPTITNLIFTYNSASSQGGGMYNDNSSSPTITNVTFNNNLAQTYGGGIANSSNSNPTLTNVTFINNTSNAFGGGVTNANSSPSYVNVTFTGNSAATYGGGMYSAGSNAILTNVTFNSNSATSNGGGMYNSVDSDPILTNVTFSGNSAPNGAGLYSTSSTTNPTLINVIVANSVTGADCVLDSSATINASYSLMEQTGANACGLVNGVNNNIIGSDPNLGSLTGSPAYFPLNTGSPAINAGINTGCPATDQRGATRPQGANCDIGSFEFIDYTGLILYVKPSATGAGTCLDWANACTLQTAISVANSGNKIWVMQGTYKPHASDRTISFTLESGVEIYGGFAGTETLLSQRNYATNVTTLSGDLNGNDSGFTNNAENSYHVVTSFGVTNSAILDGFTISGGNANGSTTNRFGGGMYNASTSSPTLNNLTFTNNYGEFGGGMLNENASTPVLNNITFTNNSAASGGGMANYSGSTPTLTNVTFSGNTANFGGGLLNFLSNPTLVNVTFSGNTSGDDGGGGMYNSGNTPILKNVIIANSTNGGDCVLDAGATIHATSSNNLIEGTGGYTCDMTANSQAGNNIIGSDPALGSITGSPAYFPLNTGSLAINAGTNTGCPSTSQNGVTRPQGSSCDIGSFELANYAPTSLVNSVLPTSRTPMVGSPVTIFNTVLNSGTETASGVSLSMSPAPAGTFSYTQTSCATNAVIGAPNAPVDIAPGGVACYVLSFTPSAAFSATQVHIQAQASNASGTTLLPGINTWLLRATASQGPDIIALTTTTDFHQVACSGLNAFAVALSNVGTAASGDITVSANTGSASLPISVSIQETNPGTGTIIGDNILNNLGAGENRTVAVFVTFNGCVSFDPAANRIFIEFRDASNNVLGSTSTAVSTNR